MSPGGLKSAGQPNLWPHFNTIYLDYHDLCQFLESDFSGKIFPWPSSLCNWSAYDESQRLSDNPDSSMWLCTLLTTRNTWRQKSISIYISSRGTRIIKSCGFCYFIFS